MKIIHHLMGGSFVLLICLLVVGCAGMPPDWWNPSGSYGAGTSSTQKAPRTAAVSQEPIPAEQDIAPAVDEYEEMRLDPLSTQEEVEAETIASTDSTPPLASAESLAEPEAAQAAETTALPTEKIELGIPSVLE